MVELDGIKYYDVQEITQKLNNDTQTVRRWIRTNKLKASKVGRKYYVKSEELERFMQDGSKNINWFKWMQGNLKKQSDLSFPEKVDQGIYDPTLMDHLHFINKLFPEAFKIIDDPYKKYYADHVDNYLSQTSQD